jgi:hypothetical protein
MVGRVSVSIVRVSALSRFDGSGGGLRGRSGEGVGPVLVRRRFAGAAGRALLAGRRIASPGFLPTTRLPSRFGEVIFPPSREVMTSPKPGSSAALVSIRPLL